MKLKYSFLILSLFLLIMPAANAATIHGTVYDWTTLESVPNTIITVNSNPPQTIVSKDGTYSFELAIGDYTLSAIHYTNKQIDSATNETISITNDGIYTMDLILFPESNFGEDIINETDFDIIDPYNDSNTNYYIYAILITTIILVFILRKRLRGRIKTRHVNGKITTISKENKELPKELKQIISVLKKNGGRMTQKDIRKTFPLSEAKVSLMITELEDLEIIKRIKTGRTNVVVFSKK